MSTKNIFKLAQVFEQKYERLDQDPDSLSWEDADPEYFGQDEESEFKGKDPSWETLNWVGTQVMPKFLGLSKEDQDKVLSALRKNQKR